MWRGAGLEATTQALHRAAPAGDQPAYVKRLLDAVRPFIDEGA
jgi:hypothetical protein